MLKTKDRLFIILRIVIYIASGIFMFASCRIAEDYALSLLVLSMGAFIDNLQSIVDTYDRYKSTIENTNKHRYTVDFITYIATIVASAVLIAICILTLYLDIEPYNGFEYSAFIYSMCYIPLGYKALIPK